MRHLNRSAAFVLGSLALLACSGPAEPGGDEAWGRANADSGSQGVGEDTPDDSKTTTPDGSARNDDSWGTRDDEGHAGRAQDDNARDPSGYEGRELEHGSSGGRYGSTQSGSAGRYASTVGAGGAPAEPEAVSYDGVYQGELIVLVEGAPCTLGANFDVEDNAVRGIATGTCQDSIGEFWLTGVIEGTVGEDGSFTATVLFPTGRVEAISGTFVESTHEVLANVGDVGSLNATAKTIGACTGAGCCVGAPDGTVCDYDGDPCRKGACEANLCVADEDECPGRECSFGTCYTEGECGDGFCDSTESHASCVSDCVDACYGSGELCRRALLDVTFAGTHNSHASSAYDEYYLPAANTNQTKTLTKQLDDGIRYLAIDFHECSEYWVRAGELCLCHGDCNLGEMPAAAGLDEVATWMTNHPNEIVIMDLEVDTGIGVRLRHEFARAGLLDLEYKLPEGDQVFRRTLGNMINLDQRLVVFSKEGFISRGTHLLQTDYSLMLGADRVCTSSGTAPTSEQFYQIEHTRSLGVATPLAQACINTTAYMQETAEECQTETGHRPNTFSVDFYETGAGPLEIANRLNGVAHIDVPYADDGGCLYCESDANCGSDEYCLGALCVPKAGNGAPCSSDVQCSSDACYEFYCAECSGDSDCGPSEFCLLGACTTKANDGVPCTSGNQCSSNICHNGLCSECRSSSDCAASETCVVGQCLPKAGNGTPCTSSEQCSSDHCSGVCVECTSDSHCGDNRICVLGACANKAGKGTPCVSNSQCASGHCYGLCG